MSSRPERRHWLTVGRARNRHDLDGRRPGQRQELAAFYLDHPGAVPRELLVGVAEGGVVDWACEALVIEARHFAEVADEALLGRAGARYLEALYCRIGGEPAPFHPFAPVGLGLVPVR